MAVIVDILEELVPRQIPAALDEPRQTSIADPALVPHPAFAAKRETYRIASDGGMPIAQRGQPKAVVGLRIFAVADAKERELEQSDDSGEHALALRSAPAQMGVDALPDTRQHTAEHPHPVEFGFVPRLAPARMITILFASPRIATSRLDVPVRERADPHRCPRRRYGEGLDPAKRRKIAD